MIAVAPTIIDDLFFWEVKFPFSWDLVAAVKEIPGRSYDPERRVWLVPGTEAGEDGLSNFLRAGEPETVI